jgi:hypothetical protein
MNAKSPMIWTTHLTKINPETGDFFTEDEAKIHVKSFRKNSIYYWIKHGYSTYDAEIKVKEFQQAQNKKYIKAKKEHPEKYIGCNNTQIEYWIKKGYTKKQAKQKVHERQQTFSKKTCIKKYGLNDGLKIWQARQIKWQKTLQTKTKKELLEINKLKGLSLKNFIEKYGKTKGLDLYCEHRIKGGANKYLILRTKTLINKNNDIFLFNKIYRGLKYNHNKVHGNASKESLKYLIPIYKHMRKQYNIPRNELRIGVKGSKEFTITTKNKKTYLYDFTCLNDNKKFIIEYNHKSWHPNPFIMTKKEWNDWKHLFKDISAEDVFNYDEKKRKTAEELGFKYIVIWNGKKINKELERLYNEIKCIN